MDVCFNQLDEEHKNGVNNDDNEFVTHHCRTNLAQESFIHESYGGGTMRNLKEFITNSLSMRICND